MTDTAHLAPLRGSRSWLAALLVALVGSACGKGPTQITLSRCEDGGECGECREGCETEREIETLGHPGNGTDEPSNDDTDASSPDSDEPGPDPNAPSPEPDAPTPEPSTPSPEPSLPGPGDVPGSGGGPAVDDPEPVDPGGDPEPMGECTAGQRRCLAQTERQECSALGAWGDSELCPFVCLDGTCVGECTPGSLQCDGLQRQSCDTLGTWQDEGAPCLETCEAGACTGLCIQDDAQCLSTTVLQTCGPNGAWDTGTECEYACLQAACGGECRPGELDCSPAGFAMECLSSGFWAFTECPYACDGGMCTGECVPGAVTCSSETELSTCGDDALWQASESCEFVCSVNACSGVCTPGIRACASESEWWECDATGNFGPAQACNALCTGGGECRECTPGERECQGDTPRACANDGTWQSEAPCSGGTPECNAGQCRAPASWSKVALGTDHTCALRNDGTLWCWGRGDDGARGDGTLSTNAPVPVQVLDDQGDPGWSDWTDVEAGGVSCGIRGAGSLWCWGSDLYGRLGLGSDIGFSVPRQVVAAGEIVGGAVWEDWISVSSGNLHSCGLRADGSAWCWGYGGGGRRGDGSNADERLSPARVVAVGEDEGGAAWSDFTEVTVGAHHSCGLRADGTLWCWGANAEGQRGMGSTSSSSDAPVQVVASNESAGGATWNDWQAVDGGYLHTCGLRQNGTVWCWGANASGQLGDGTTTRNSTPQQVLAAGEPAGGAAWNDWISISVGMGSDTSCGQRADGSLWCWGRGSTGARGDASFEADRTTPAQVLARDEAPGGAAWTDWSSFAAGGYHVCGLRAGNTLWCWGSSSFGQRGTGVIDAGSSTPTRVWSP